MLWECWIKTGVPREKFEALDDARHNLRTSFQAIGTELWDNWLAEQTAGEGRKPRRSITVPAEVDSGLVAAIFELMANPANEEQRLIVEMLKRLARKTMRSAA